MILITDINMNVIFINNIVDNAISLTDILFTSFLL
jgi:hypothetical protein